MFSHRRIILPPISLLCHTITAILSYSWPTVVLITHLSHGILVEVNRRNESLLTVPQDVPTNVTYFILAHNEIAHIDFNSFKKYTELFRIDLSSNPLKTIANGTFENNHRLSQIICIQCVIESAPASFGPCTSKILLMNFYSGVVNSSVLLNFDFIKFSRLSIIKLKGIVLPDLNVLELPPSIWALDIANAEISILPQVGHTNFPKLTWLKLKNNKLSVEIPYSWFDNISMNIRGFTLAGDGVTKLPEILPVKPHLLFFAIEYNRLLTLPDMLDFPALEYIFFRNNPITCDQKMCWKRLWDRKRAPLHGDDASCQMPPFLRGTMLSNVDPKAMGCYNGEWPTGVLVSKACGGV